MIKSAALALAVLAFAPQPPADGGAVVSVGWVSAQPPSRAPVILFVGSRQEYDAGHIPGAQFLPNDAVTTSGTLAVELPDPAVLEQRLEALGVSDNSRIVIAHGRNSLPAATRALFTLKAAGLNASLLDGGHAAWEAENRPVSQDVEPVKQGSLSPLKLNARIVDATYVQSRAASPDHVIIDARDPQFYAGTQAGFGTQTRGHIKGAKSITYSTLLKPNGELKDAEDIKAAFVAAGVGEGDEVIAYCHVGQQATVIMLGAELAGVKAVLYDGSYQDWSQKGLPVEAAAQ
jgi:thiosulfate/3-mercaptopyruvate sulfurtransferase